MLPRLPKGLFRFSPLGFFKEFVPREAVEELVFSYAEASVGALEDQKKIRKCPSKVTLEVTSVQRTFYALVHSFYANCNL